MKTQTALVTCVLVLSCIAAVPVRAAEPKVEEIVVGPANDGGTYTVSRNGARVAYVLAKGSRMAVVVDGVEGPVVEEMLGGGVMQAFAPGRAPTVLTANLGGRMVPGGPTPVLFSDDGKHYAYMARQGNEYIVVHDGKEIGRGPRSALAQGYNALAISPHGKLVYWSEMQTQGGRGSWRLLVNGKPGPWAGHQDLNPVFSRDDSRYAYAVATAEDPRKSMLVVDGKVAGYVGHTPQFTADSKVLLTIAPGNVVLVDGKPGNFPGISLEKVVPGPVGSRFAVIMRKRLVNNEGVGVLFLDSKEMPGTEGAMDITFSPDGKHYALRCRNPEARTFFMVIDGKKGVEYQSVADKVYWTPDSTKAIYQVTSAGRNFVIVNTDEFPVQMVHSLVRAPIASAATGGRYAFSSVDGSNRNFLTIVDGKQVLPEGVYPDGDSLEFSANGARYAFAVGQIGRQGMIGLVVDGTLNNTLAVSEFVKLAIAAPVQRYFVWSPDGKYLARMARTAQNTHAGLYVNEKLVYPTSRPVGFTTFTPDGRHLYWLASETFPDRPQPYHVLYVDGHPAVKLSGDSFMATAGSWAMEPDGVMTFAAVVGDVVKRHRVTPPGDTNVDTMIVRAEEAQARVLAEAAAATKKKEEDALAAKQKTEADAAKRKADYDAAIAARNKARLDAIEARKKAAADAAAAKAKKK